jgi:hypothetical protein
VTLTYAMRVALRRAAKARGELDERGVSLAAKCMVRGDDRCWLGWFDGLLPAHDQIGELTVDGYRWTIHAMRDGGVWHRPVTCMWLSLVA